MKKPRIAACFLTLAMALWAAHPVALADGLVWLTPEDSVPEQAEESSVGAESSWFAPVEEDAGSGSGPDRISEPEKESGLHWLDPDEARDEAPVREDETRWLSPSEESGAAEEEEDVPEPREWLTADDSDAAEVPAPEEEEPVEEWLTLDELPDEADAEPAEEPEGEEWLTLEESKPEEPEPEEPSEPEPEKPSKPEPDGGALIEVTVPVNGDVVINPHRLPVMIGGTEVRDQIINSPQLLTNRSDVPIIVTASVTVNTEGSGGLSVTDQPIAEGETEKLAYLYVEFQNVADSEKEAVWSGGYTGAPNQLLASGGGTVTGDVLRVEAGDKIPTFGSYRLFGSLTENPASGWQTGDKLSVTVSFTFRPAEEAEPEEEAETAEEPEEADEEPVEAETEPEEIPEMKDKADAKTEEAPVIAAEPEPEPDPGPEPEPEPEPEALEIPAYEPAAVFEREEEAKAPAKKETEFLASAINADWMAPPDVN